MKLFKIGIIKIVGQKTFMVVINLKKDTILHDKSKKSNLENHIITIFKKEYKYNIIECTKAAQFLGLKINSKESIQLILDIIKKLNT